MTCKEKSPYHPTKSDFALSVQTQTAPDMTEASYTILYHLSPMALFRQEAGLPNRAPGKLKFG